jgi:hypothetical protein
MHCDEVIRELVVPTDDRDSATVAEHLANCPSCAGWAERDAQFDRLWNATRPIEPSPQVWVTVWAHIASSFDSSTPAEFEAVASPMATLNGPVLHVERPLGLIPASSRARPWNWAAIGLIGLAQAAAVLLAVGWIWRGSNVEIEAGQTVVIQFDAGTAKVINHMPDGISNSVDDWLLVFNAAEAFANPVVAMH